LIKTKSGNEISWTALSLK